MKKAIIIITACFFLFGFTNSNKKSVSISNHTKINASTLLTVHNTTANTTIYSVTIDWYLNGDPQTATYYTNIGPVQSSLVDAGNLSDYVTVTLSLSHSRSGSLRDWYYDTFDDLFIYRGCQNFTNTFSPSLYFYYYGVNHFYLNPNQDC